MVITTHKKMKMKPGFTLADVIIGLGLFIVIMSAFFVWLISSQRLSSKLLETYEAANYGRSAIEAIEQLRNKAVLGRTTLQHLLPGTYSMSLSGCFTLNEDTFLLEKLSSCSDFDHPEHSASSVIKQTAYHRIVRIDERPDLVNQLPPIHSSLSHLPTPTGQNIFTVSAKVSWNKDGHPYSYTLAKTFTTWPSLP